MTLVQETLNNYATEGRRLYHKLYLEPYVVNNYADATSYIVSTQRYNFICEMMDAMQFFGWLKDDEIIIRD